ncbi:MAG: hypothetical protein M1819_001906 [Sarea resinae]|nr:MAG: hypothetical protein M1819_001906 [Sarea resinae]
MSPPISVRLPIRNADADAPATTATSGKRTDEEMALPPRESEKNPTASELLGIANTAPENQAQPKIEISSSERPPPPSEAAVAEHQQRNPKSSQEDQNDNDERSEILANPREPLKPFDWADLEERYHQAMGERKHAEEQIYEEFNSLFSVSEPINLHLSNADRPKVFSEWSQTVTIYEQDRSLKRY